MRLRTVLSCKRTNASRCRVVAVFQTCMGKDVTLHVSASNPAMLLYQKFGFKAEEYILDFYDKYYPVDSTECRHAFFLRLRRWDDHAAHLNPPAGWVAASRQHSAWLSGTWTGSSSAVLLSNKYSKYSDKQHQINHKVLNHHVDLFLNVWDIKTKMLHSWSQTAVCLI